MVQKIVKGKHIFARKAQPATEADKQVVTDLIDTLRANREICVGMEEGCLSLDGVRACVRYEEIEVDYLDSNFKPQHGKYSGFTAQIIQHEIDHCNGVVI